MRGILHLLAAACLLPLLAGCRSGPAVHEAATPGRTLPDWITDTSLKRTIELRGGELASSGQAETCDRLATQLDRTSCALTLPAPATSTLDPAGVYRAAAPGTLVISRIYYCDKCQRWHSRADATAFAITADGACVTNYHVFDRAGEDSMMVVTDAWGEVFPVLEVLAASRKDDAAIFRVGPGDAALTPLPLRAGTPVGTPVAVLSHPAGHFYSLSPGHIARRSKRYGGMVGNMRELAAQEVHGDEPDKPDPSRLTATLEITADYGVGSSGGPVLDDRGNVVGMVSNTLPVFADRERKSLQMNFHHCVPAESILALIRADPSARPTVP